MPNFRKLTFILFAALNVVYVNSFVLHPNFEKSVTVMSKGRPTTSSLFMNDNDDVDRLRALGYSEDELRRARKEPSKDDSVRVDLVDDVDAVTLTALGFGLIALNFLVFANMGDGGIAGVVATIMNTWGN